MSNSATVAVPAQLRTSAIAWRRLRRIGMFIALIAAAWGAWVYLSGGGLFLSADGLAVRERISVSAPYDARIKQVFVKPGDHVEKGQTIAIVESASISRTLADLSAERARISARVAQLEARQKIVGQLLPVAEESAKQAKTFLDELLKAETRGMTVARSLQEISAANFTATERVVSLKAEQDSLEPELRTNKSALEETNAAYAQLERIYDNGVLRSPVTGYVGSTVAYVGEVLVPGKDRVAQINTGKSFVLAFMPESYLFDVEKGESVLVKARGRTVHGTVEKILPVTEALPPEFQLPGKALNRGQVVRIALQDPDEFAVDEKVRVKGCFTADCSGSPVSFAKSLFGYASAFAKSRVHNASRIRSAQL
ncbi:MAG: HlyD family efflux transporter periplasmic adaptor subunit [Xanthobacteraceae bacterium]